MSKQPDNSFFGIKKAARLRRAARFRFLRKGFYLRRPPRTPLEPPLLGDLIVDLPLLKPPLLKDLIVDLSLLKPPLLEDLIVDLSLLKPPLLKGLITGLPPRLLVKGCFLMTSLPLCFSMRYLELPLKWSLKWTRPPRYGQLCLLPIQKSGEKRINPCLG